MPRGGRQRRPGRPPLDAGITPRAIDYQLRTNPEMAELADTLQATQQDLLALSVYIRELTGDPADSVAVAALAAEAPVAEAGEPAAEQAATAGVAAGSERLAMLQAVEDFSVVVDTWERRAREGSLMRTYEVTVAAEFDPGEPKFTPEPGKTYFYENAGTRGTRNVQTGETFSPEGMKVVVGDAETREVIAWYEIAPELRSSMHSTALSPDGRYVYISGASPSAETEPQGASPGLSRAASSVLKVDALTLQPVRQLSVGGRMHHAQVFQDRYMLIDTFAQDPDALTAYLFDPETDRIIGGVHEEDLGGNAYTAWTDNEFIYIIMEPSGYGFQAARRHMYGELTVVPTSWVARLDPETWEVLQEYPHPGHRADWICFDHDGSHMYVPATGNNVVTRINTDIRRDLMDAPDRPRSLRLRRQRGFQRSLDRRQGRVHGHGGRAPPSPFTKPSPAGASTRYSRRTTSITSCCRPTAASSGPPATTRAPSTSSMRIHSRAEGHHRHSGRRRPPRPGLGATTTTTAWDGWSAIRADSTMGPRPADRRRTAARFPNGIAS